MLYLMSHLRKGQPEYYWGRHQRVPTQKPSNVISWVFRRAPIVMGRCYISGPVKFILTEQNTGVYAEVRIKQDYSSISTFWLPIFYDEIYLFNSNVKRLCRKDLENTEFHNCFDNRLREYGNSHFVPIDKGHKDVI